MLNNDFTIRCDENNSAESIARGYFSLNLSFPKGSAGYDRSMQMVASGEWYIDAKGCLQQTLPLEVAAAGADAIDKHLSQLRADKRIWGYLFDREEATITVAPMPDKYYVLDVVVGP